MIDIYLTPGEVAKVADLNRRLSILERRFAYGTQRSTDKQEGIATLIPSDLSSYLICEASVYVPPDGMVTLSFGCTVTTNSGGTGDALIVLTEATEGVGQQGDPLIVARRNYANPSEAGVHTVYLNTGSPRGGDTLRSAVVPQSEGTRTFRVHLIWDYIGFTGSADAVAQNGWLVAEAQ